MDSEKITDESKPELDESKPEVDESKPEVTESKSEFMGKKIFFLYPTTSIVNQIVFELAQNEYEVYTAKDHGRLARILKKYPDSVLYINIDDRMLVNEWEKWISETRSSAPGLSIGIFSSKNDDEFRDKFIEKNRITCGFYFLRVNMLHTAESILEKFGKMDLKGRRKYLRASTEREANAVINIPLRGEFINGVVKDVSVVGVSCVFQQDPGLQKNTRLKDIQIKLQSMLLKAESVVFGSRNDGAEKIYVLIFTQRIDPDIKIKIRKYVQRNLQAKMDAEIN